MVISKLALYGNIPYGSPRKRRFPFNISESNILLQALRAILSNKL